MVFPSFEVARAFRPDGSIDSGYVCGREIIDVALVRLDKPVTDVTPVPLGDAPSVGAACEVVGYSTHKDPARDFETTHERRVAHRRVREAAPYRLFSDSLDGATRQGDSGGGLFCDGRIVGVLSCTPKWNPSASATYDDHARFDVIRGWVEYITGQPVFDPAVYYFQKIPTIVDPFTVSWIVGGALLIAVLASVLPARRAANTEIVDALGHV